MEYVVKYIDRNIVKLVSKEGKEEKEYKKDTFPEDVSTGDEYSICDDNGSEKIELLKEALEDEGNKEGIYKITYLDNRFAIMDELFDKHPCKRTVKKEKFPNDVEYGDYIDFYDKCEQGVEYPIFRKHKKEEKNRKLEELYVIKNIDDKNIYLLKNGEKKVIKLPKIQGNYFKLDLVYLDEENGQIKIVKDQIFTPYFTSFLSKHDKDTILNKNHFKISKWIVEYNYKHAISLIEFETLKNPIYVADYQLFPSASFCDPYFKIELGNTVGFEFDYINEEISHLYWEILVDYQIHTGDLSDKEIYEYYKNKVEEFEKRFKILKKINKQCEKYYQEHPLEYTKYEISDYYLVESKESNNLWELKSLTHSEEDYYEPLYVNEKDLPKHLREGDKLVEVLVGTSKKPKYYYCREKMREEFTIEYQRMIDIRDEYKGLCK